MSSTAIPTLPLPPYARDYSADGSPAWVHPIPGSQWFDAVASANLPSVGVVTVVSIPVPVGYSGRVKFISNVAYWGGFLDGSGWIIWQILIDGVAVKNYEAITAQLAVIAQPSETFIEVPGGSTVSWSVQTAQQSPPSGSKTICRLSGWWWPQPMEG